MHFAIPLPDRWRQMDPQVFMASWMKDFVSEKQSKQCPGEQYPILMSGFYIWAPAQTSTQIHMHTAHAHTHMERQDEIRRTWIIKIRSSKSPSSNSHITYHISHITYHSKIPYCSLLLRTLSWPRNYRTSALANPQTCQDWPVQCAKKVSLSKEGRPG